MYNIVSGNILCGKINGGTNINFNPVHVLVLYVHAHECEALTWLGLFQVKLESQDQVTDDIATNTIIVI